LQSIGRDLGTGEFESPMRRGFEFYKAHFFRLDGAPRYFHDRTYPLDIHCVAQSIITLLAFGDFGQDNSQLASSVFDGRWSICGMIAVSSTIGCCAWERCEHRT